MQIEMTQARLSFSREDSARMLNLAASPHPRASRQLPRKDYAQLHNGRPAPAAPQRRTRGRSASPLPMNHCVSDVIGLEPYWIGALSRIQC